MSNKITFFRRKKQEFFMFFFNNWPIFFIDSFFICYKCLNMRELTLICLRGQREHLRLGIGV